MKQGPPAKMKGIDEKVDRRELLESLIMDSAVATFVLDSDHKVIFWNKACEELTGVKAADIVNTDNHWKAFYDHRRPCVADIILDGFSSDLNKFYKNRSRSALSKEGLHAEDWFRNLGGKDRYLIFDAAPIRNKDGEIIAAIETLQDITGYKLAEDALISSGKDYLAAFQVMPAPAAIMSVKEKRYLAVNSSWEQLTGYASNECVGRTLSDVRLWPDDRETVRIGQTIDRDGGFRDLETLLHTKDGNQIIWLLSAESFDYSGSKCIIFSAQDITNRRKWEDALVEENMEFEKSRSAF